MEIDLSGPWQFAFSLDPTHQMYRANSLAELEAEGARLLPADVPGNFELDLLANGLIPDPFRGLNALALRQYELAEIWYGRRFTIDLPEPDWEADLVFEGLDCTADVMLNGHAVELSPSWEGNMLIERSCSVGGRLRRENDLLVHIRPAGDAVARRGEYPASVAAAPHCYESLYVRKAPHMYGWDIMPRALSAGLWRPVKLRIRPPGHIRETFLDTLDVAADRSHARLRLHFRLQTKLEHDAAYDLRIEGRCGDNTFSRTERTIFDAGSVLLHVPDPKLWWPRNRGEQNLYDVCVTLLKNGEPLDERRFTHGIRTVELDRTDTTDDAGSGEFCFRINGERVFAMGSNWVPADVFHSRDAGRIGRMLKLAEEVGCNMLRCWGGNVYEDHAFFDECDRRGIMVWQDFAMACAVYPQDEGFQWELQREAVSVIRKLRRHPSLVLWSGDNECDCAYAFGWNNRKRDPNANILTRRVLPEAVRLHDPGRPFLPSSPYISPAAFAKGAGNDVLPETHLWGPRGWYKSDFYTKANCHFVSEIGYFGCPSPASLAKFLSPDAVWPWQDNEEWNLHSTEPIAGWSYLTRGYRVQWTADQIAALFGSVPENIEDFCFASQATQAEALKFFIEHFRGGKWRRTGILWWNLIDGWPQISDAVVDYYFQKKLAFDWIRRSQQPILMMLAEPAAGRQRLLACNDTRADAELTYTVRDVETDEVLAEGRGTAEADAVTGLTTIPHRAGEQRLYLIEWQTESTRGTNHYLLGEPPFDLAAYRAWLTKAKLLPAGQ